uniref:Uncharacterized protein n=1 Tax=Chromera velia CCMP2878 TaxID=1169474 RepID=A0A0G4G781_9ALVE|eukprot:Cvel_20579.t1-p1 / transcript=Cvel_20579.t1 / gene=Cvel_20579 / organism=Chromera_velia_CCMP2878 / gene_product=hypothetical protein / transcript_product=hypothetical protein / location=Cvel_scaffold1859:2980-4378(+) / protein_length=137 / sequence_SO=supercontig / SO=protein_coding / is_pseudo=false
MFLRQGGRLGCLLKLEGGRCDRLCCTVSLARYISTRGSGGWKGAASGVLLRLSGVCGMGFFGGAAAAAAAAGWKGAASGFSEEHVGDWVEGMLREGGGFAVCASAGWGEVLIGVGLGRSPGSRLSVRRAGSCSGGAL